MSEEQRTSDALMPCTYCGSTDLKTFRGQTSAGNVEYVQCMNCTACGPDHIEGRHWNNRTWRPHAASWLRDRAERQEETNKRCPAHAACYKTWTDAPIQLRMYAAEVEMGK
jgi:hypothetical protein